MNWAGPDYDDVGMDLVNSLWCRGIPTDLIPSSEIGNKSLYIDEEGWICYGSQRYSAIILYHPEFEKIKMADFFSRKLKTKTRMFRIGEWQHDFEGKSFDGNSALPESMTAIVGSESLLSEITNILGEQNIDLQTPASCQNKNGIIDIIHPATGVSRLIDGTIIHIAGTGSESGDPINTRFKIKGKDVFFDALGVAAVRLDKNGNVQALVAGGLKSFKSGNFEINLTDRIDIALWINDKGKWEGVIQGWKA
jgi:hypothetical protein